MIQESFAVTTLLSSSCRRCIRDFTKSMQLAARKITANTRDPSAVIAISIWKGKKVCLSEVVNYGKTHGTMS